MTKPLVDRFPLNETAWTHTYQLARGTIAGKQGNPRIATRRIPELGAFKDGSAGAAMKARVMVCRAIGRGLDRARQEPIADGRGTAGIRLGDHVDAVTNTLGRPFKIEAFGIKGPPPTVTGSGAAPSRALWSSRRCHRRAARSPGVLVVSEGRLGGHAGRKSHCRRAFRHRSFYRRGELLV